MEEDDVRRGWYGVGARMDRQQGDWSAREPNVWVQLQSGSSAMYEVSTAPLRAVHGSNVTVEVKGGRPSPGVSRHGGSP
jgi:hypothetical protein